MANNYSVNNTVYTPMSFDEMLKPVLIADTEHKELEKQIGEIDVKRALIEGAINEKKDNRSYEIQKEYQNNLTNLQDNLLNKGLQFVDRGSISKLRSQYANQIAPIERALQGRQEIDKMQREKSARDSSYIHNRMANDISLDELVDNPNYNPLSISGEQVYKTSAQAYSNLSKKIQAHGINTAEIPGYIKEYTRRGYSEQEAIKAMLGEEMGAEFQAIQDNLASSFGVDQWKDGYGYDQIMESIKRGALSAIGQDDIKYMSDKVWDFNSQMALTNYRSQLSGANKKTTGAKKDPKENDEQITRAVPRSRKLSKQEMENKAKLLQPILDYGERLRTNPSLYEDEAAFKKELKAFASNPQYIEAYKLVNDLDVNDPIYPEDLPQTPEELSELIGKVHRLSTADTFNTNTYVLNSGGNKNMVDDLYTFLQIQNSPNPKNSLVGNSENGNPSKNLHGIKLVKSDGSTKPIPSKDFMKAIEKLTNTTKRDGFKVELSYNESDDNPRLYINNAVDNSSKLYEVPLEMLINQSVKIEDPSKTKGYREQNMGSYIKEQIKEAKRSGDTRRAAELIQASLNAIHYGANSFMQEK